MGESSPCLVRSVSQLSPTSDEFKETWALWYLRWTHGSGFQIQNEFKKSKVLRDFKVQELARNIREYQLRRKGERGYSK
ncbi:unnamed protein product [Ilex paraguariensis]|uniref:LAGLIDADG homing endonuclease n=1 Tax=Ilex paraguariensis TaxID=185542 RepID=A0ABC8TT66_9AQUA